MLYFLFCDGKMFIIKFFWYVIGFFYCGMFNLIVVLSINNIYYFYLNEFMSY